MKALLALGLVALSFAGTARAADDDAIAKERDRCTSLEAQSEMNSCSRDLAKKIEGEMQRAYEKLVARVDSKDKKTVRDAQRAWTTYRDRHCTFQASGVEGGSVHALIYNLCDLDATQARLKELAYHSTCEEGDLSCPYPVKK
jgi:uncharacterized protein YecT (DUF1311 family)